MEFDRDGQRYDERLTEKPSLSDSLYGDYYGSHWDKSGVLEADCFMCHLSSYSFETRTEQLKNWNLKWASTAASGIGTVEGSIYDVVDNNDPSAEPKVTYNKRLFNEDGKIVLDIKPTVDDNNCMQCHGPADMKKRAFSWHDEVNPDVHSQQGMHCVDCHPAGMDHNFAKGHTTIETLRDDLDNSMRSCKDCHTEGYRGATIPKHVNIPPSHLKDIACETCHIPQKHRAAGQFFDTTHGNLHWDIIGKKEAWGKPEDWYPAYMKFDGKIIPINPIFGIWWGNREKNGIVYPLFARELAAAWGIYGSRVTDDNGDGFAEVNKREEIRLGLKAVETVLHKSSRFEQVHAVFIKGDKAWEFNQDSLLVGKWDPVCKGEGFSISHNVAPTEMALGANGCPDCHGYNGEFFKRTYIVDPYDENGNQVIAPVRKTIGISDYSYNLCAIHFPLIRPYMGIVLIIIFFVTTLHFTSFGPHDFGGRPLHPRSDDYERIDRFNLFERLTHLFVLFTFIFLALTGLAFAYRGGGRFLELFFGNTVTPRVWHGWLGFVFGIGVLFMLLQWWRDAMLIPSDKEWVRNFGGYLGGHDPVPADRFNAGQKVYFWTVIIGGIALLLSGTVLFFREHLPLNLVFTCIFIHYIAALFGVSGVLSHVYLSTGANPGTFPAIFVGKVTKLWARRHHPLWYEKITGKPASGSSDHQNQNHSDESK